MYHHLLGYLLLAGISVNIFQGINILGHDRSWKWAYIGVLAAFAAITLGLEIYTWKKFLSDRRQLQKSNQAGTNATNNEGKPPDPGSK